MIRKAIAVAFCVVAAIALAALGAWLLASSPRLHHLWQAHPTQVEGLTRVEGLTPMDVGFLRAMALHHQTGLELAAPMSGRSDAKAQRHAQGVMSAQGYEIGLIHGVLAAHQLPVVSAASPMQWVLELPQSKDIEREAFRERCRQRQGTMPTIDAPTLALLENGQRQEADVRYARAMREHHEEAIAMSRFALPILQHAVARSLALQVISKQSQEIIYLQTLEATE